MGILTLLTYRGLRWMDEIEIERTFLDCALSEAFDEVVFDAMRRGLRFKLGDKKYGCGCHNCYREGLATYEWAFPEESQHIRYEDVPKWLLVKEKREEYVLKHYGGNTSG